MTNLSPEDSPVDEPRGLSAFVSRLEAADGPADERGAWPEELWSILVEAGAARWALPESHGGDAIDRWTTVERYIEIAAGSLTAAFILTQYDAGLRRLVGVLDRPAAAHWVGEIAAGRAFTTVGISQLTTSRRHGASAVSAVETRPGSYLVNGMIPWVTGAPRADVIVTGAVLGEDQQMLIALPTDRKGVSVQPAFRLAALQASCTAEVVCEAVEVDESDLLAGPTSDVLGARSGPGTGGLETSALALGQAKAALDALESESPKRADLLEPVEALKAEWEQLWAALRDAATGRTDGMPSGQIRGQANALALRSTQAYLTARKGSGFLLSDPAQRWARQALFFLVWSCPSPVAQAAIRDMAGLCSIG